MTSDKKTTTSPFYFTSHDGTDEANVRAEVYVQTNKGVVKEIKENTEKQVADVHFGVQGLKYPIHGWVRTDYAIYELIKAAKESGEEITFRIETQRKANVDRSIPMDELRADAQKARDNVKVILVGINGVLSDEAVTNPSEDPKSTGGRYVATDADVAPATTTGTSTSAPVDVQAGLQKLADLSQNSVVRLSVIDAIAAQLLLQGADLEAVNKAITPSAPSNDNQPELRQNFAVEGKPWDTYNSDGRLNLGSGIIAAGVGIETLIADRIQVRLDEENIEELTNKDDLISYYTVIVFAICDRIQEATYGQGFKADRKANSHTRVRGIVYEMIKKDFALPFTLEGKTAKVDLTAHNEWVKSVGKEGIKRFNRAISASVTETGFKTPLPASLGGTPAPVNAAPAPAPAAQESAPVQEPKAPQSVTAPEPQPEPVQEPTSAPEPVETTAPAATATTTPEATVDVADDSEMFIHQLTQEDVDGEELATDETINFFKTTLSELGLNISDVADQARIARLLGYSFGKGFSNARKIPDVILEEFTFFYQAGGAEALDKAIRKAVQ